MVLEEIVRRHSKMWSWRHMQEHRRMVRDYINLWTKSLLKEALSIQEKAKLEASLNTLLCFLCLSPHPQSPPLIFWVVGGGGLRLIEGLRRPFEEVLLLCWEVVPHVVVYPGRTLRSTIVCCISARNNNEMIIKSIIDLSRYSFTRMNWTYSTSHSRVIKPNSP